MWILSTVSSMGYLSRMTQWKVGHTNTNINTICFYFVYSVANFSLPLE